MRTEERNLGYLVDVFLCCTKIERYLIGIGKERFLSDDMLQSAVVRQLEVAGEATKNLSEAFREKHPDVPWRKLAGIRDRLIHGYRSVDLTVVWEAATVSVPQVRQYLEPLLPERE